MSVKQVLNIESDVVTDMPIKIPFDFKKGTYPEGKNPGDSIVINPITVRTAFRLRPLLMQIDKKDLDALTATKKDNPFTSEVNGLMSKYEEIVFDIICIGMYNKKGNMPDWFKETLKDNCTWKDLYIILNAILFRLGCNSFMNTITTLQIVSPLSEAEIIALQNNSRSWGKK